MPRLLRFCALFVFSLGAVFGVDWKSFKPEGYVSDFAGVVDPASKAQLEQYCAGVERATGVQIALVTLRSLEGEPIEDVANTIFRAWGVGQKGKNDGALLLLSIGDRRSRLELGYGLEPAITDGLAGSMLREMRPALRQQHYGEALLAAAHAIAARVAGVRGVSLQPPPRRIRSRSRDSIPWPMLLGGLFLLLWLMRGGGRPGYGGGGGGFLPGLILGSMMSRGSWGSRGSGGFGGPDSGDGFGGFGGGDSGGGGASSDW